MKKLITLLLVLCSLFAKADNWATFYIDPSGSDASGTGSIGSPWKTLYKACSQVTTSGNTIHVNAGTYLETLQSTLAVGVSIEGADSATTIIQGTMSAFQVEIINARSLVGTNGNQHITGIKFDGRNITSWGVAIYGRSNVAVYGCTWINFNDTGILFVGGTNLTGVPPPTYATGNTFYNNTMYNCSSYNTSDHNDGTGCIFAVGQEGMTIHDNYINQSQKSLGHNGWPIKATNFTRGMHIYNNTLYKIPYQGNGSGDLGWDFAIEMADEMGVEINDNIIHGSIDLNRQTLGGYAYSAWVHGNLIYQDTLNVKYESGIIFEYGTQTAIIEDNIIDKTSNGLQFNTRVGDTVTNITIRNNLVSNMGRKGLDGNNGSFIIISSEGSPTNSYKLNGFNVYNNTFYADSTARPNYGIELGNLEVGYEKNMNFKNNIIANCASAYITSNSTLSIDSLNISYNDIYQNNGNATLFAGAQPTHYTNTNNIHLYPQFVTFKSDYHLKSNSPCIDAGIDVGLPFFNTAPDIGYVEYGSNIYPTANAGADQNITLPTTQVTMAGSGSDGDGTIVSHAWTQVSGATATITTPSSYTTTITGLTVGTYVFRLTVTDNDGATGSDDMTVTVSAAPSPSNTIIRNYIVVPRN